MTKRTFVTFKTAFPDEAQWTEKGSPLVPDGRSISQVLADATKKAEALPFRCVTAQLLWLGF